MIAKNEMMPLLLSVCPSFTDEWRKFLDDHKDHADPPLYIALGDLARHLVGMLERNDVVSLQAVFRAVEQLHVEGDDYVREAATIGLLEDLQNGNLHRKTDPEQFRPFLGAESLRAWDELNQFWNGGEPG